MFDQEKLLRKYTDNFILIDEFKEIDNCKYLSYNNIVTVVDKKLKINVSICNFIKYLQENFKSRIIYLETGEPDYKIIEYTSKKIFSEKCDLVIGLGGGSILDIVKASSMIENSIEAVDNFSGSKKKYKIRNVKTLAIPTTAGTGSEFTHTSVYKTKKNIKNWLWDELTFFDYVLYVPKLTLDLPIDISIASGIDAFDHLIESLISLKFKNQNRNLCNTGIDKIWHTLPQIEENKNNIQTRSSILLSSGIAGKAIHFTGCGICHCIAHTLGSMTKVPHGVAIAYALLNTIEPVLKFNSNLIKRFDNQFLDSNNHLSQKIQDWIVNFKIDYSLIENKIDFEKFIKIYFHHDNKSMRDNTYYKPKKEDLKFLLQSLWI